MKILSGRFPVTKNVTVEGEVTYNGTSREEIRTHLPQYVSYVTQRDHHFPTLSVKETLEFAHACCGEELPSTRRAPLQQGHTRGEQGRARGRARAVQALSRGCDPAARTAKLPGHDRRQRDAARRVGRRAQARDDGRDAVRATSLLTLMDEISTGLDSAATFDIVKTQRSIAKKFRKTVVIALLQPSPEVFALFDDVLILNEGRVMYHGPRDQALGYFESLGFKCPPRRDVADFLLDVGTSQQHKYEVARADGSKHPRKAREFAEIFEKSAIHHKMLEELHGPHDPALLQDKELHFDQVPQFHQTFYDSTVTLMRRQLQITMRNTAFIKGRGLMVIIMGLMYSTVFWQFDVKQAQVVMGIMFAAVLFLALGQASQIPTYMAAREIFYKQRGANFFRTLSYVLACSVSQLPLALLESVVFGSMVYWMCGFVPTVQGYVIFELLLFLTNLAFAAWFFFLSALSPDLHQAKPISMVSIMFYILFAGFVISKDQIPDYFIWAYWLNPIAWCLRSLAINQYRDDRFNVDVYDGIDYKAKFGLQMGEYSLSLFDVESDKAWLWYGVVFMVATYVVFMSLSFLVLEYKRYESPENVSLSGEDADDHSLGLELSSVSSSTPSYGLVETPRGPSSEEVILEVKTTHRERSFVPVTLAFKDLWYSVPDPANPKESIDLLKGISGFALPGTMTALMGSSGAGKTTLMDVIAGRKTGGKIRGQILLNGHEATDLAIRRCTGYCEQMDIHSEASTIREALTFSAFLRQGSDVPDSQKYDSVEECLELLDLHPIADQIIRGSSVEQMKRLTIGVELAAQPSVLFLDEPTSGLDARSAKVIMDGVRKVANTGRTIVCTIHQPSSEVFQVFDSLLLLKRGGETVFFGELGESASELIEYFESVPGVAPIEDGYNPATWMLEVIGAGVGNASGSTTDFCGDVQREREARAAGVGAGSRRRGASGAWCACARVQEEARGDGGDAGQVLAEAFHGHVLAHAVVQPDAFRGVRDPVAGVWSVVLERGL
ncbi:hypothetical protein PINS_up008893 [Pythium insidiosum]|nr:hypothetical protein PINS_up008893 [Pythium insidiosum]